MSIINQMLKDIEQREKDATQGRATSIDAEYPVRSRAWLWALSGALCVAIVLTAWWSLSWYFERQSVNSQVISSPAVVAEVADEASSVSTDSHHDVDSSEPESSVTRHITPVPRGRELAQPVVVAAKERPSETVPAVSDLAAPNTDTTTSMTSNDSTAAQDSPSASDEPSTIGEMTIQRSTRDQQVESLYRRGLRALDENQMREASQRFQEVLLLAPDHHEARLQLAALTFGRGFPYEALTLLQTGLEIDSQYYPFLLLQARIYERLEQPEQALATIHGLTFSLPEDADLVLLQANLASDIGDWSLAVNSYQQLVEWRSDQGHWWIGYAFALTQKGDENDAQRDHYHSRALEAYRRALNDNRLSPAAYEFAIQQREALGY